METREWSLDQNGRRHTVVLQHDHAEPFLDVLVNGKSVVLRSERLPDGATLYRFTVNGEPATLTVRSNGSHYSYDLKLQSSAVMAGARGGAPTPIGVAPVATPSGTGFAKVPTPPSVPMARAPTPVSSARVVSEPELATPPGPPVFDEGPEAPARAKASVKISPVWIIGVLVLAALVGVIAFVVKEQSSWARYEDQGLGFEVEIPPGPLARSQGRGWIAPSGQQGETELTKLTALGASWEVGLIHGADPFELDKVLEQAETELGQTHKVTQFERTPTGFKAEMMTAAGPTSLRVIVDGRRVYTVSVRGALPVKAELKTRFFDSFQISRAVAKR